MAVIFNIIPFQHFRFSRVLTLALALTLVNAAPLQDEFTKEEIENIEMFSGNVMACGNILGLALGVVRGDTTFSTGLGVADIVTAHPIDKRTIFNLGSTAKAFVPYVLAEIMNGKENHDGRLKWNSTLREIMRHDLDLIVPEAWADLTLKDMLIYKSGRSAADMATMVGLPEGVTREELIRRTRFLPEDNDFRKSNHYSNVMYTIAGHLAERMSGISWEELVKARVLDKQYMNTSSFAPEGMTLEDAALPYRHLGPQFGDPFVQQNMSLFDLHPSEPVGSLMASAEDVTKWLRHLLHNLHVKGNDTGVNMLIEDAFHQWVTLPADHKEGTLTHDSEVAHGYGMGWYVSTYRGQRRYRYSGHLYAYSSEILLFPESQSAVFVAINSPGTVHAQRAMDALLYHIADVTLRKPSWVDSDTACCCQDTDYDYEDYYDMEDPMMAPAEIKRIIYLEPLQKYIGEYGNGIVGNVIIEPNEAGILSMKLGRNLEGELTPGKAPNQLKFLATGWLRNTEEWATEKKVEFLDSTTQHDRDEGEKRYSRVKIHLNDKTQYDFERGKLFETMLIEAELEEKRQKEAMEAKKEEEDSQTKEGNENWKNEGHSHSENDLEKQRQLDPNSHQNHQPYSVEGQDDRNLQAKPEPEGPAEPGRKVRDHDVSTNKPRNSCSSVQTFSILVVISFFCNVVLFRP